MFRKKHKRPNPYKEANEAFLEGGFEVSGVPRVRHVAAGAGV